MTDPKNKGLVYREFGDSPEPACQRATPELPPQQQNLRLQASRAGRKGKTVTVITGLQCSEETREKLLKQLKTHCGSGGTLKDNVLELQGDHCQKLLPLLLEMGYKAKISGG
jgi:translation initiation factor 1